MTVEILIELALAWLTPKNVLEAGSAALGAGGAYLLAAKSPWAGWAFVAWLFSNLGWIVFGWLNAHWLLAAQHAVFAVTSALGIWMWLVLPLIDRALSDLGVGDTDD